MLYLTTDSILAIHNRIKEIYNQGGLHNIGTLTVIVNDASKVESNPLDLAAQYTRIAYAQPFTDSNRRTSFATSTINLRMNGYKLKDVDPEEVANIMTAEKSGIGDHRAKAEEVANWLKANSRKDKPKDIVKATDWFFRKYDNVLDHLSRLP